MIRDTYAELITQQIIKEILSEGIAPTASEIASRFATFIAANDLSKPLLEEADFLVENGEVSSASKFNEANRLVAQDLSVLFSHLLKVSDKAINNFYRWKTESTLLEGRLSKLEDRLTALLLTNTDTAGFFNFIQDNLSDNNLVDLENSTAHVDPSRGVATIGTSTEGSTRLDLTGLTNKDIVFSVLTKKNLISTVSSDKSETRYAVSDVTNYWQEKVYFSKEQPVTIELRIDLKENKAISRLDVDLHMSNSGSTVQLTPMYSSDNYNWKLLPVTNYTRSVLSKTTFRFPEITARYVKFIMTKIGPDNVSKTLYTYEFGANEISFYSEAFDTTTSAVLISKPLAIVDENGNPESFSRIALEVCEDMPAGTLIDYSVLVSTDPDVPLLPSGFVSIAPLGRTDNINAPQILDFGESETVEVTDISISYSPFADDSLVNPDGEFSLITGVAGSAPITKSCVASDVRYGFVNSNDRILSHSLSPDVVYNKGTLELWRNVNVRNSTKKVRGEYNGWRFEDPYYKTTVLVKNPNGVVVDFGESPFVLDEEVVSGSVAISTGSHTVWIHKNNWKLIPNVGTIATLAELKAADSLYPYNQKYLVEGITYESFWTEEKVYFGFDIVAEHLMTKVDVFDLIYNVPTSDYSKFGMDIDAPDTARLVEGINAIASEQTSNSCFVLKVNENNPDFLNEKFVLRFNVTGSQFQYLRFKAAFTTDSADLTPLLSSYRVKVASKN